MILAPNNNSPVSPTYPEFKLSTLDNGLRIVTAELPNTYSVSISVYIGVGARFESVDEAGISHMLEHLVFKGTARRPNPVEISGVIENVGGVLNAATEQELTVYWCKVAFAYLDQSLELLIDMVRNSLFSADELERERLVILEELNMVNDQPNSKVEILLDELLWPEHPLGRDVGGNHDSVKKITRDMVVNYVDRFYRPNNTVISVAGNVNHDHIVEISKQYTKDWVPGSEFQFIPYNPTEMSRKQVQIQYRKTEQSHLALGFPGVSIGSSKRYHMELLSVILGEGMSSRLFLEIREKLGLAYDIHSESINYKDCGALLVMAGVDPGKIENTVSNILDEILRLSEGISELELEKAKRMSQGAISLQMEDTKYVSAWMGMQELILKKISCVEQVVNEINKVDLNEINLAAKYMCQINKVKLAVLGPHRQNHRILNLLQA